jgi:hypothetical protein
MNDAIKVAVLKQLGGGSWKPEGQTTYRFAAGRVHARFKTSAPFSFNINPATLRADYELWICGSPDLYYLLPKSVIRSMYEHPAAYVDQLHPEIRVVSVDAENHRATFARGGEGLDLRPYFRSSLDVAAV